MSNTSIQMPGTVELRNPHSILEALKARPRDVKRVSLPPSGGPVWAQIEALCTKHHIKLDQVRSGEGNRNIRGDQGGRVQSFGTAQVAQKKGLEVEELFSLRPKKEYGIWLATDCIQDPQNLGSIFRVASFFGVQGILMTTERSAPMSGTVYDVAVGGVESVPFTEIINLKHAIEVAKSKDIWILGTSEHATESLWNQKLDRDWLVVLGNEEKGLRRLTQDSCDVLCQIPHLGKTEGSVTSLNVSVACGIFTSWFSR